MNLSHIEEVIGEHGYSVHVRPKKRVHGGPDSRSPRQIIQEYGLKPGSAILLLGEPHVVSRVVDEEVFVKGLSRRINVYQIEPA